MQLLCLSFDLMVKILFIKYHMNDLCNLIKNIKEEIFKNVRRGKCKICCNFFDNEFLYILFITIITII